MKHKAIKNLSYKENEELHNIFPYTDFSEEDSASEHLINIYTEKYISVFDHGLSTEEAEKEPMFYEEKFDTIELEKQYKIYERSFMDFYTYLFDNTRTYGRLFSIRGSGCYVGFESKEVFTSHVLLSVREKLFLTVVLPDYKAIIDGGFDLTHILRVRKEYPKELDKIRKIMKKFNLHILD